MNYIETVICATVMATVTYAVLKAAVALMHTLQVIIQSGILSMIGV